MIAKVRLKSGLLTYEDMLKISFKQWRLQSSASCWAFDRTHCVSFADRSFSVYGPRIWKKTSTIHQRYHLTAYIQDTPESSPVSGGVSSTTFLLFEPIHQRLGANFWFWRFLNFFLLIDWLCTKWALVNHKPKSTFFHSMFHTQETFWKKQNFFLFSWSVEP